MAIFTNVDELTPFWKEPDPKTSISVNMAAMEPPICMIHRGLVSEPAELCIELIHSLIALFRAQGPGCASLKCHTSDTNMASNNFLKEQREPGPLGTLRNYMYLAITNSVGISPFGYLRRRGI